MPHVVVDCFAGICLIEFHTETLYGKNKSAYYDASLEGEQKCCSCLAGRKWLRCVVGRIDGERESRRRENSTIE